LLSVPAFAALVSCQSSQLLHTATYAARVLETVVPMGRPAGDHSLRNLGGRLWGMLNPHAQCEIGD
jgi:hypothetical protein